MNPQTYTKKDSFAIIGGDDRSIATANHLSSLGFDVNVFAFNDECHFEDGVIRTHTLEEAIASSQYVLLPLPCLSNEENVNTPLYDKTVLVRDVIGLLNKKQRIFAGKINNLLRAEFEAIDIPFFDYSEREEFSVLNAIPTAEGAIEIAMKELPVTVNGSVCLVLGFGRIAKILAHTLQGMGAQVTTAARRYSDLAWINAFGYNPLSIKTIKPHMNQFQIVFNTVPHMVLDREMLSTVSKDCLIIDLASKPGGADETFR